MDNYDFTLKIKITQYKKNYHCFIIEPGKETRKRCTGDIFSFVNGQSINYGWGGTSTARFMFSIPNWSGINK